MFNYEEFKEEIRTRLLPIMGEKYENCVIEEMMVAKMGKNKDGFGVRKMSSNNKNSIMPTMYYDDLYRDYLNTDDFDAILHEVAGAMVRGLKEGKRLKKVTNEKLNYDSVVFQLINPQEFQSLLNDVPHRYYLDLAVIYRWCIDVNQNAFASAVIDNEISAKMGYTEEELFKHALKNTSKIFQPIVQSMQDVAFDMFVRSGATSYEATEMVKSIPDTDTIYFVSNGGNPKLGATVLMYPEKLKKIANRYKSDLYILPLSSMEIIVIPSCFKSDLDSVYEAFDRLSKTKFEDEEEISSSIYYYDHNTGEISIIDSMRMGGSYNNEQEC